MGGTCGQPQAGDRDAARRQRPGNDPLHLVVVFISRFLWSCRHTLPFVGVASAVSTNHGVRCHKRTPHETRSFAAECGLPVSLTETVRPTAGGGTDVDGEIVDDHTVVGRALAVLEAVAGGG